MENKPQPGLGEYLRSEREKRHITIEQVASATKINIKLLHALEGDNYDALPAKPFVRGFITSYTRYVGLDHREVLTRFEPYLDEKSTGKFSRPADAPHIFVDKDTQTDNSKTVLSVVMVGFLVIAIVSFVFLKPALKRRKASHKGHSVVSNEEVVTVVPPPSEAAPKKFVDEKKEAPAASPTPVAEKAAEPAPKPTPVAKATPAPKPTPSAKPAPTATVAAKPAPKATPAAKPSPNPSWTPNIGYIKLPPIPNAEVKHRLIVRALDDSWVKYQVDDRPVQQYMLRKDKKIFVRARQNIRFTSGKPEVLEISYDNVTFNALKTNQLPVVLPKQAEAEFKERPFIPPNPAYLSTPNQ